VRRLRPRVQALRHRTQSQHQVYLRQTLAHVYCDWRSLQGTNPLITTASVVEDFLTYLFEVKKLTAASITEYRSLLTSTLRKMTGTELSGRRY